MMNRSMQARADVEDSCSVPNKLYCPQIKGAETIIITYSSYLKTPIDVVVIIAAPRHNKSC